MLQRSLCLRKQARNEWRTARHLNGKKLLDSVLGATLQRTSFDDEKRCVARPERSDARALCGADVLSNHGVNLASATAVMLAAPGAARWWLLRA